MNTNYNNNVAGALKLITINGSTYQLGKDASTSEGGILKLFGGNNAFETYKTSTVGTYDAKTVYDEIDAIKTVLGSTGNESIAEQLAEAKTAVAAASSDYITVTPSTDSTDGHAIYTIGTSGIDTAISSAVNTAVAGIMGGEQIAEAYDTIKEIADWISSDTTGAAAILADVANKADKVDSATNGNFAGLDGNGNLTDSGYSASSFQAAGSYKTTQGAVSDPTASGNALSFIDSISQNTNGVISATKKTVYSAGASQAGLMSAADYNKLAAISASVSNETLTITTQAAA